MSGNGEMMLRSIYMVEKAWFFVGNTELGL